MLIKTSPKLPSSPSTAAAAVYIQQTSNIHVDQPSFFFFALLHQGLKPALIHLYHPPKKN